MKDYKKAVRGLPELRYFSLCLGCQVNVRSPKESVLPGCNLTLFKGRVLCVHGGEIALYKL